MLFGHNSNVTIDGTIFHVQTEDRGTASAIIDTTVHCRGRVLHRRKASYQDLLPLNADKEQALKLRLDDQQTVQRAMRAGRTGWPGARGWSWLQSWIRPVQVKPALMTDRKTFDSVVTAMTKAPFSVVSCQF